MKRINPLTYYTVGQQIEVEMHKPEHGKFPIARAATGVICRLAQNTKGFFEYNSCWTAEIMEVREKSLIIKPLKEVMTAEQNERHAQELAQLAFGKEPRKKEKKAKNNYQYRRSDEIQA